MGRPPLDPAAFPAFRPRAPWWGPDLQTLRNTLRPLPSPTPTPEAERLRLPLGDGTGDVLLARLERPDVDTGLPLVVLIHGLGGSEESHYLRVSSSAMRAAGHPVVRLNLRGAGPSAGHCAQQYHAGRSADLETALRALPEPLVRCGVFVVGFSLGGNALLKMLGETGRSLPLLGAASVSAPIDLARASARFLEPRNAFYQRHLLRRMKEEVLAQRSFQGDEHRARVGRVASVFEFDEVVVAPANGFDDAADYYERSHARPHLAEIEVPTLVIHAQDDPWIPAATYLDYRWDRTPALTPLLPRGGGHVGFHARESRVPWHDRCLLLFLRALGGGRDSTLAPA